MNLRLVWGGPQVLNYVGTIELDNGLLTGSQQLGIDPNDSSFLFKDSEGKLKLNDRNTRFGGCDIRVQSKSSNKLTLRLEVTDPATNQSIAKEFIWTLKSLQDASDLKELDFSNCRISIARVPGDLLRVVTQRSHLIYNSGEPLNLAIRPYGLPWTSTTANLECTLVRLDDDHQVFRKSKLMQIDGGGFAELYDVSSIAPSEEGVYELRLKVEPKRLLPGLLIRYPSVERTIQLVVFNEVSVQRSQEPPNPQEKKGALGWQLLSQLPIKNFESQPLTNLLMSRIEGARRFPLFDFAKSLSRLAIDSNAENSEATEDRFVLRSDSIGKINIKGLVPGRMHRLKISSTNPSDTYRVCLSSSGAREQKGKNDYWINEVFDAPPTGSIALLGHLAPRVKQEKMEVLFWPNSRNATLEITNLNATTSLRITEAAIEIWPESTGITFATSNRNNNPTSTLEIHSLNCRNCFGIESSFSSSTHSPAYDDWQMYLQFASRIGEYCQANGFDTLALTVHAQGASLFPTSKLSSNARFDTGTFSAEGRDPLRKDVVELLYRVLPRQGIAFVPMLDLDSPIREVEEAASRSDQRDLFQHRDAMSLSIAEGTHVPHLYNPLSPRVQQAIAIALDEFDHRYRSHPNYCGFALKATTSHLNISLPIEQTNTTIIEQFAGSVGGNLPKDASQREQFISQRLQSVYSQWIRESVHTFLTKLRAKPRWVSVEPGNSFPTDNRSPAFVSPVEISRNGLGFYDAQQAILSHWFLGSPGPIHASMDSPMNKSDSNFTSIPEVSKQFWSEQVRALPYRDASRSVSKVRVWVTTPESQSLLISNSGAVSEWIRLNWEVLPNDFRIFSSQRRDTTTSNSQIEVDPTSKEWRIALLAGEVLRVECDDPDFSPVSWYCQETETVRSLDSAMQSIEQAVARLSVPQPRPETLTNPSFEASPPNSRRGRLTGWTTSIDPNTLVEIDSQFAKDGQVAIKIEASNASAIAWLQSDPFALTPSDRVFVSFQFSAEQTPQSIALTLYQFDAKSDRFETIAVRDFTDKAQRQNNQIVWVNLGLDLSNEFQTATVGDEPALYRLQFEAKGKGRVWIDDVSISTSFLRETERRDLRSELFLARTSLQNGDSGPAVAMLTSPRGSLVRWGDSFVPKPNVMVSLRNGNTERKSPTPSSTLPKQRQESPSEAKASDAKLRPIQRLRNSWWSRKEQ